MVQPNTEARPRRTRARRSEEQALLVESHLGISNDVIMDGENDSCCANFTFFGIVILRGPLTVM